MNRNDRCMTHQPPFLGRVLSFRLFWFPCLDAMELGRVALHLRVTCNCRVPRSLKPCDHCDLVTAGSRGWSDFLLPLHLSPRSIEQGLQATRSSLSFSQSSFDCFHVTSG